jgi:hypothetical protein
MPLWQVSPEVQRLPSSQGDELGFTGFEHAPVAGLHTPTSWHVSVGIGHMTGFVPVHEPAWQTSDWLHAFPSLHGVPSAFAGFGQPLAGSHVPTSWHWSLAVHVTVTPLPHTPAWHVSPAVHALLSLHTVPLGLGTLEQAPVAGLHVLG